MSGKYLIKDAIGNILNTIIADESFVSKHYEFFEKHSRDDGEFITSQTEWRDSELLRTDSLMLLPDYPYKDELTIYRQALRDWPSTEDFPETRPSQK